MAFEQNDTGLFVPKGSPFEVDQFSKLIEPKRWDDFASESPLITERKIQRAQELGVVAVIHSEEQVDLRIKEMAAVLHALMLSAPDSFKYLSILKGSILFTGLLFAGIGKRTPAVNPEVDYIQVSRYAENQAGDDIIRMIRLLDPKTDFAYSDCILTDEVVDEGFTIDQTAGLLLDEKQCTSLGDGVTGPAKSVGMTALATKGIANLRNIPPSNQLIGFSLPNVWAGGAGLDGPNEMWRWLPELVITKVQHEKYRDIMPEVLETLGPRAVLSIDDIQWIDK